MAQSGHANSVALGTGAALGYPAHAYGESSTAIGRSAYATGQYAMALGVNDTSIGGSAGRRNGTSATGKASFAVGHNAEAAGQHSKAIGNNLHVQPGHNNSHMFGSSSWNPYDSDGPDRTYIVGEVKIEFCIDVNRSDTGDCDTGMELKGTGTPGVGVLEPIGSVTLGGGFNVAHSDKNNKKEIQDIDYGLIFENLLELDITTWKYKNRKTKHRYLGPMAQDFYKLFAKPFELESDDKGIVHMDMRGVTLAASKAAAIETEKLREENEDLKNRVEQLEAKLEKVLDLLERED